MIARDAENCLHLEQLDNLTFWQLSASRSGYFLPKTLWK